MKLLHASDFHLDAPFAALSPEKAALRRAEGRELLGRLALLAREERVDLVLLPGDLFDSQSVYPETLTALREALASIPAPVFIAPGNHDFYAPGSPYAAPGWPENVTIFNQETFTQVPLPALGCTISGFSFCHNRVEKGHFASLCTQNDPLLHLAVAHAAVSQGPSDYHPVSPEEIARTGLDYLALGHIHTPSGLQKSGDTYWAYPGCPEGHGFDELGERGCLLVDIAGKGRVSARFCPLAKRRYLEAEADVTGSDPLTAALAALEGQSPEDCVKLLLTGECDFPPALERLERELEGKVFALRLRDRTRPRERLWDKAGEDTLTGAFLRRMREALESGDARAELAVRFGLAALERGEDCRP